MEIREAHSLNRLTNHEDYKYLEVYIKTQLDRTLSDICTKLGEQRTEAIGKYKALTELLNLKEYVMKELAHYANNK